MRSWNLNVLIVPFHHSCSYINIAKERLSECLRAQCIEDLANQLIAKIDQIHINEKLITTRLKSAIERFHILKTDSAEDRQ
jgi:hypothetical protein